VKILSRGSKAGNSHCLKSMHKRLCSVLGCAGEWRDVVGRYW